MKQLALLILPLICLSVFGQNYKKQTQPIVEEGKLLYKSEMASWNGTDIFVKMYKEMERVGGYFSYTENDLSKCVFFSRDETPKVLGTITFDSTYNPNNAVIAINERDFKPLEADYYTIRAKTTEIIKKDTLFNKEHY